MVNVTSFVKTSAMACAEPLICFGLKAVLNVPVDGAVAWLKERFTDHSQMLPRAIQTANEQAWQAVCLALGGPSILERLTGWLRPGDMKAMSRQIKVFVDGAESGWESSSPRLREQAASELQLLLKAGAFDVDVEMTALDLTRFVGPNKLAADATSAVTTLADHFQSQAPQLAHVLRLTPPSGGMPLLAAAFCFFLRRQIATNEQLARELTQDGLNFLTQNQRQSFESIDENLLGLARQVGDGFEKISGENAELKSMLEVLIQQNHVQQKPESPLRISVSSEAELQKLRTIRDRMRKIPEALQTPETLSMLGDCQAAAGEHALAKDFHQRAAVIANEEGNRRLEAEAAFKAFKDACEIRNWDDALASLRTAIEKDEERFRPVPHHYDILAILGAGAFGIVLLCRNKLILDDDDQPLQLAVKTFREEDLERDITEIFTEANTLKNLIDDNIIRVVDHGFTDSRHKRGAFLAMEYFPGVTLETLLAEQGKLSIIDFTMIFRQIAQGLHAAHTRKKPIYHRDVKPANIMVQKTETGWVVKVIDFGLAVKSTVRRMSLSVPQALRTTRDKSLTGTIKYAAPEQLGEANYPIGPYSDVYAFGKMACEALLNTVNPSKQEWRQLPDALSDLLDRCKVDKVDLTQPDSGRWHDFQPILKALAATPSAAQAEVIILQAPPVEVAPAPRPVATPVVAKPESPSQRVTRLEAEAKAIQDEARAAIRLHDYETAARLVSDFRPELVSFRDDALLRSTTQTRDRLRTLDSEIHALLNAHDYKHPKLPKLIAEYIKLKPNDGDMNDLARVYPHRESKAGDKHELTLPGGFKMPFAYCPPGTFLMGSPESEKDRSSNEQQHKVTLTKGFWMAVSPVTQAQWQAIMGNNPSDFKGANLPVEKVSWEDTQKFNAKLTENVGHNIRLPTEAEWEYACRGGTKTPFYWGDTLNGTQANCNGNYSYGTSSKGPYLQKTTPVGTYAKQHPHPWGLVDVHGNVWEWCEDWYDEKFYSSCQEHDPICTNVQSNSRVLRGGSWSSIAKSCRASNRGWNDPTYRSYYCSFRVCFCME